MNKLKYVVSILAALTICSVVTANEVKMAKANWDTGYFQAEVYKQALEVRKRAISGEDFGKLATEFSQDPSAKDNKGDLGYFTAFRMVYAFENGAYKTPKGSISNPVRTRFGYHLIKVNEVRQNRGDVIVAHIMIMNPSTTAENKDEEDKGKNTIQDIYKKLQQGEKFEDLAKQFSEDKSSSSKGGVLNRFGSGQLSSDEFENVDFQSALFDKVHYSYFGTLDFKVLADFISSYSTKLGSHPNDVCVLALSIETIREIDFHFRKATNEKSYIMAETKEFYDHLKEKNGQWTMNGCVGNKLLKEINPMNMKGLTKEKVISQINALIKAYYSFMGYIKFSNYIEKHEHHLNKEFDNYDDYGDSIINRL